MSAPVYPSAFSTIFLERFRARSQGAPLRFDEFMQLALYDPEVGYYRQNRARVGYGRGTDFFTAQTSGSIFGELICAACTSLLGKRDPSAYRFVEIGAEPGSSVLQNVPHPFHDVQTLRIGDSLAFSGSCVVFSNELFDAQPFRRFIGKNGRWEELGVAFQSDRLAEIILNQDSAARPQELPSHAPEGYHLDLPLASRELACRIAAQPWNGLFVALDYGKSWPELIAETPGGTGRAYYRHTQLNDLIAHPGEQDLTCHICWDWLCDALLNHRFSTPSVESQEAFFIHHASAWIAQTVAAEAQRFSQRKLSLMQLLHPAHLGQKFQVLHAFRAT